jgi:predicted transcriptional regulator
MADKTPGAEIKERFTTTLDGDLLQKIKILAIYEKCTTNILLEEAIKDLLKKYEDKKEKEKTKQNESQNQLFKND